MSMPGTTWFGRRGWSGHRPSLRAGLRASLRAGLPAGLRSKRGARRGGAVERIGPLALVLAGTVLFTACTAGGTDDGGAAAVERSADRAPGIEAAGATAGAGGDAAISPAAAGRPAVTVPAGYVPPGDRVDSTGAYVPVNGKPTLVYVDAIW